LEFIKLLVGFVK